MKIALLIRGIVYSENYIHYTGKVYKIDYKSNLHNIQDTINSLKQIHEVDIYIATYDSKYNNDIINDFNPKSHVFLASSTDQKTCLKAGLNLITDYHEFVIITRFDLKLKRNLLDLSLDYEKFNLLWKEQTQDHRVNDCIHMFNYKYLNIFIEALDKCPYKNCIHHISLYINDINILFKDYYDSNSDKQENPVYTIERGNIIGYMSQSFWTKYLRHKRFNFM